MSAPSIPLRSGHVAAPDRFGSAPWVLGALALWLIVTLGLRPLLLPDEGRYATVALEMLHGDTWIPTLNGLPFFHKPPLFYWVDLAAMQLLGLGQFTARAGSLLGAWTMGAALYAAMRRWHPKPVATLALTMLASSPFFFVAAQYANHDMLVAGLITAAILALARAVDEPPAVHLGWLLAGALACALATLAKGLIGCVLPALVIGPWLLLQGRWRQLVGLLHPLGLLVFCAVALPWFVAMQMRYPGFFDYFIMEQHFRRFALSSFNNVQPFWFFAAAIPALMLPWALWLPAALRHAWRERDTYVALYLWWTVAIAGFFSLPSSKLVGYALPALPPLCALLAMAWVQKGWRRGRVVAALAALLCLAIVAAIAWQAPKSNRGAALALATWMQPGDRVAMVDEYLYDVPFYADLRAPVLIASDWADPQLPLQDSWRKELFDAARFDPALGRALLRPIDGLDALACGTATVWFTVSVSHAPLVAALTGATRVYADRNSELWRVPPRACH